MVITKGLLPTALPQAERRELQESQRAAKAAAKAQQVCMLLCCVGRMG